MSIKTLGQRLARVFVGRYQLVRIYRKDLSRVQLCDTEGCHFVDLSGSSLFADVASDDIRSHACYAVTGSYGYGLMEGQRCVCACWYWTKQHSQLPVRFFPELQKDEAVMVDLVTTARMRGKGYASALIRYSESQLRAAGFCRLRTWVWHSNGPSIRTFEKSGWTYTGFRIEIEPFRRERRFHIYWPATRDRGNI